LRAVIRWALLAVLAFYSVCVVGLLYLRWLPPLTTALQVERRVESWLDREGYRKRYRFVPLAGISPDLRHAVIAAEDGRFYQHRGFDWEEMGKVLERDLERGRLGRGASTITQQLVKNLFLSARRSLVRKGIEFTLVPPAELILPKQRILELYLNVIEWGPGVYGAEAAARYHYGTSAARLNREQAARLAAILPAPRTRRPARMNEYSAEILERMRRMGW
jgi:monofunctional biosynthetic peptidoglycan transglycosylase